MGKKDISKSSFTLESPSTDKDVNKQYDKQDRSDTDSTAVTPARVPEAAAEEQQNNKYD